METEIRFTILTEEPYGGVSGPIPTYSSLAEAHAQGLQKTADTWALSAIVVYTNRESFAVVKPEHNSSSVLDVYSSVLAALNSAKGTKDARVVRVLLK